MLLPGCCGDGVMLYASLRLTILDRFPCQAPAGNVVIGSKGGLNVLMVEGIYSGRLCKLCGHVLL